MKYESQNGKRVRRSSKLFSLLLSLVMLFNLFAGLLPTAYAVENGDGQIVVTGDGELNIIDSTQNNEENDETEQLSEPAPEQSEESEPVPEQSEMSEPAPVGGGWDDDVKMSINGGSEQTYQNISTALAQFCGNSKADTVKLTFLWSYCSVGSTIVIDAEDTVTIDLNGCRVGTSVWSEARIIENNGNLTIIDSAASSNVMYIAPNYNDDKTIKGIGCSSWEMDGDEGVDYFKIQGGCLMNGYFYSDGACGAGIINNAGATLNMTDVNLVGNHYENYDLYGTNTCGGGIYNAGTLNVTGGQISFNGACRGAGIYNIGKMKSVRRSR